MWVWCGLKRRQHVESRQQRKRTFGDFRDIGEIADIADAVAVDNRTAVLGGNRHDLLSEQRKRAVHFIGAQYRQVPVIARVAQGIAEP